MKIAFVGKGGSGKTTLASLFSHALVERGGRVLAIDADINQHLALALGMPREEAQALPQLGNEISRIKAHVRGENERIASAEEMLKTTPPGRGSRFVSLAADDPMLAHFAREVAGLRVLATGPFTEEDLGVKCYHSKTGAVELLLNHLLDGKDDYVIVDMTAGADSFASGLFTRFDATFVVVEPTLKSVSVFAQYKQYAAPFGVKLFAVANKVMDEADLEFIRAHAEMPVAVIGNSAAVRKGERTGAVAFAEIEPKLRESLSSMQQAVDGVRKDWAAFKRQADHFHAVNAESWGNAAVGKDVRGQIDPEFSFEEVLIR